MTDYVKPENMDGFIDQFNAAAVEVVALAQTFFREALIKNIEPPNDRLVGLRRQGTEYFENLRRHASEDILRFLKSQIESYTSNFEARYQDAVDLERRARYASAESIRWNPTEEVPRGDIYLIRRLLKDGIDPAAAGMPGSSFGINAVAYYDRVRKRMPPTLLSEARRPRTISRAGRPPAGQHAVVAEVLGAVADEQHYIRCHVAAVSYLSETLNTLAAGAELEVPDGADVVFRDLIPEAKRRGHESYAVLSQYTLS
ncbi:MAG: hypothetical protein AB7H77_00440 [Bdellovibrionales bacterium]